MALASGVNSRCCNTQGNGIAARSVGSQLPHRALCLQHAAAGVSVCVCCGAAAANPTATPESHLENRLPSPVRPRRTPSSSSPPAGGRKCEADHYCVAAKTASEPAPSRKKRKKAVSLAR